MKLHHHVALLLPAMLVAVSPIATASANQADTAEAAQTTPANPVTEAANAPGQPIKGVIVKGGQNPTAKGQAVVEAPGQPGAAARDGGTRTYTAGRRTGAAPEPAEGVKAPAAPARSISEKGVK